MVVSSFEYRLKKFNKLYMSKLKSVIGIILLIGLWSCEETSKLPDPLEAGWNNTAVCEVLVDNDEMRVLKCSFAPGVGHDKHYHPAHYAYAISGSRFRIEDKDGIREVDFPTGSNYYSEGVEWHKALNIGDSNAVVLIIENK